MRGLVFEGVGRIGVHDDLPDPRVQRPTDAVIHVTRSGLCGSDLHPYEGRERARVGVVPGHEAVGEVVAVGQEVASFAAGRRVLVPFATSCGRCRACLDGLSARCVAGALFGFGDADHLEVPALHGAQAEYLRVPLADGTLVGVPDSLDDEAAVLLTDNVPTGWVAATRGEIGRTTRVVIVGLGAVGLASLGAARALGAGTVVAVDPVASRRASATALGADQVVDPAGAADAVAEATAGIGVDTAIEASGTQAGQALAASVLRPGGTLSIIAVQTEPTFAVSPVLAYDRNLTIRAGRASVRSVMDQVLARLESGDLALPTERLMTHPARPLAEGPKLYQRFAEREPGMVKASMAP